jgi:GNAT superfamily N-acetyltransferase
VNLLVTTLAERPHLEDAMWSPEFSATWGEFMHHNAVEQQFFLPERFARYHGYAMVATDDAGAVVARSFSVPFRFGAEYQRLELPKGGWTGVVHWADADHLAGRTPNAVSALEIAVHPRLQARGVSALMLQAMRRNASKLGFATLYAPVRPAFKHLEPFVPMTEYAARVRSDGLPSDGWLRVHVRAGGRIVGIAPHSATIAGTLADWRAWTGLPFDESGAVIVPGALVPVHASVEHDHAVYVEPNVWVEHRLEAV